MQTTGEDGLGLWLTCMHTWQGARQDTPAGDAVVLTESRQVRVQLCLLSDHFIVVFHLELGGADVVPTVLVDSSLETMQPVVLVLATLAASMGFPAWRSCAHAELWDWSRPQVLLRCWRA